MKKLILIIALSLFAIGNLKAQNNKSINKDTYVRSIEVNGSAEIEVPPDEIIFVIRIEEYWKEEFQKHTKYEDYKTKIPLEPIETELMQKLIDIGVKKDEIKVTSVGNYSRNLGKDFLKGKTFELHLKDFALIDKILNEINFHGIDYMRIDELKNKDIIKYRQQVKIDALKAAQFKAKYLLEAINKKLGDPLNIVETEQSNDYIPFYRNTSMLSNTFSKSSSNSDNSEMPNYKSIKLRYEVKAIFEIID